MSNKNICPICGKPTRSWYGNFRKDGLCGEHADLLKNGKIYQDGTFFKDAQTNKILNADYCEKASNSNKEKNNDKITCCPLCGVEIDGSRYKLCMNCHYNVLDRMDELDKNQKPFKLKDYYYNAKDYALRIYDEEKIYYQELTMYAIANILSQNYNDNSIAERLDKDIILLKENLETKTKRLNDKIKEKTKIEEVKTASDSEKAKIKRTQDGHYVESEYEIMVDDILYTHKIVHAYNKKVDEISERTVICDWYIPVLPDRGIYIELWGVKGKKDYNENREEKNRLYKKYNLSLIEIEHDELKGDTHRLVSNLLSQIRQKKEEIKELI